MKLPALGIALATFVSLPFFLSGEMHSMTTPLILLLPLSATLTMLAAYAHSIPPEDLLALMILLALGLGFMLAPGDTALLFLGGIFIVLMVLFIRHKRRSRFSQKWGMGLYGFALAALLASFALSSSSSVIALFLVYAVLLPAFPLHGASIASLSHLRGILPGFLALFLPALGLKGILTILSDMPPAFMEIVSMLALCGAIYGGSRALVQSNPAHRLAYAGLAFWSILWWYLAGIRVETAPAILYFCALALIMQGLFLSWHFLEVRHGDLHLGQLGGLARVMPRFGVLLSLLVAAGMGLPLFGSFTALIAMAASPAIELSGSFAVILLAWLLASWHFPLFMQRILFGPTKPGRIDRDLDFSETLSLTLIVSMIVMLGISPSTFFGPDPFPKQTLVSLEIPPHRQQARFQLR